MWVGVCCVRVHMLVCAGIAGKKVGVGEGVEGVWKKVCVLWVFTQELQYHHLIRRGFISTGRSRLGRWGWCSWEDGSCHGGKVGAPCSSNPPPRQPRSQLYFEDMTLKHLPAESKRKRKVKLERRISTSWAAKRSFWGLTCWRLMQNETFGCSVFTWTMLRWWEAIGE